MVHVPAVNTYPISRDDMSSLIPALNTLPTPTSRDDMSSLIPALNTLPTPISRDIYSLVPALNVQSTAATFSELYTYQQMDWLLL